MKLILCHQCQDVFKFGSKIFKSCSCGNVKARYIDDLLAEFYCENDDYSLIGFANSSLGDSISKYRRKKEETGYKLGSMGIHFDAFVIPEPCPSIKKIDKSRYNHISNSMIKEAVTEIVAKVLKIPEESLYQNESLIKDCGADELDIVHIVIEIEKAFDISIYDEGVYIIDSLSELEKVVYSKIF